MAVLRESPWYQEILKEGIQIGIEQGIERGARGAKLELVLQLLSDRFGDLDPTRRQRIENLSESQLNQLARQVLHFNNLNDLDTWLQTPHS
jgi:predicted transposase YdaD